MTPLRPVPSSRVATAAIRPGLLTESAAAVPALSVARSQTGMKIATIGPAQPVRGGIALYTSQLVHHLRRHHEVAHYSFHRQYPRLLFPGSTRPDPGPGLTEESEATLDGINPLTWWRTSRLIQAHRPDLLLLQWWTPFWLPLYSLVAARARAAGTPVLTIVHQFIEPDSSFFEWFVARSALRRSDGLIVMTEEEHGMARRVFPSKPVRLAPLPGFQHWQSEGLERSQARQRLGIESTVPLLLFFGFVRRYKGLSYLLQALARTPDVHLLVAGEFWESESWYREQISRLGLADRVTITNRYIPNQEVETFFAAADALVLPYVAGNQSAVGTTALALGLPIIATTVGGLQELVIDGETGLLVAPANSEQLGLAIARYFDQGLAARFRRGIARDHRQLSWSSLVGVIEEISTEILAGGRGKDTDKDTVEAAAGGEL